jgi:hypothetical protein
MIGSRLGAVTPDRVFPEIVEGASATKIRSDARRALSMR